MIFAESHWIMYVSCVLCYDQTNYEDIQKRTSIIDGIYGMFDRMNTIYRSFTSRGESNGGFTTVSMFNDTL